MNARTPFKTSIMGRQVSVYKRYKRSLVPGGVAGDGPLGQVTSWGRGANGEPKYIIDIHPELESGSRQELDTLIHELLHVADWDKDEDWINNVGYDLARTLWRLGWRKETA